MPGKSANGMSPCACSLSEKTKKNFKKKSLTREKKKDAARKSFCHFLIGNTALITWTDRPPTAVGRILRYLIHRHRFGPSSRIRPQRIGLMPTGLLRATVARIDVAVADGAANKRRI